MSEFPPEIPPLFHGVIQEDTLPLALLDTPRPEGRIKTIPEDFEVEEIPAFDPSGSGDFLYLWVEKKGVSGGDLLHRTAQALDIHRKEIGHAGLKDKQAVTRQMLSVPYSCESRLTHMDEVDGVTLLRAQRHEHKLRTGKLRGNRFRIRVRTREQNLPPFKDTCAALAQGIPNFFGEQRFGKSGHTAGLGWGLLRGDKSKRIRNVKRDRFLKRLAISAAQAALFNRYLSLRIERNTLGTVDPSDIMSRAPFGGMFTVDDVETETRRMNAGEITLTGPIFGNKDRWAKYGRRPLEEEVYEESTLPPDAFAPFSKLAMGTRRPLIVVPQDMTLEKDPDGFVASFSLPTGSYATILMRELYTRQRSESPTPSP